MCLSCGLAVWVRFGNGWEGKDSEGDQQHEQPAHAVPRKAAPSEAVPGEDADTAIGIFHASNLANPGQRLLVKVGRLRGEALRKNSSGDAPVKSRKSRTMCGDRNIRLQKQSPSGSFRRPTAGRHAATAPGGEPLRRPSHRSAKVPLQRALAHGAWRAIAAIEGLPSKLRIICAPPQSAERFHSSDESGPGESAPSANTCCGHPTDIGKARSEMSSTSRRGITASSATVRS